MKVLIIGGGIGGLAASAAFGTRGVEVEVLEIRPSLETKGIGINQPGNSLRVLKKLGVLEELMETGYAFDQFRFHDLAGNVTAKITSVLDEGGVPANLGVTRPALHQALEGAARRAGATITCDTTFAELSEDEAGIDVTLTDGSTRRVDLVVGFDGINSQLRTHLFGPECTTEYSGFGIWRINLPRAEEVDGIFVWQGYGNKCGVIPMGPDDMYMFHVTHEPDRPRFAEDELWSELRDRLEGFEGIPGEVRDGLGPDSKVVYGPLDEILVEAPWHRGRVVIAGDAVHASAPHLTQGAGMALEDAWVLAELVTSDMSIDDALLAFVERRHERCGFVQGVAHQILMGEMESDPEAIEERNRHLADEMPHAYAHVESVLNAAP